MAATMLHKEYGTTRSPWYSIGGYTVATATAVSRMLNNKHWLSDVMVGAGIGILSTEVGYFLTDLIFKDKGITHSYLGFETFKYQRNPSFFGIYMGFSLMPTKFNLAPDVRLKASPGSTAGFEGAWFMNRYIGFGGRISATKHAFIPYETIGESDSSRYDLSSERPKIRSSRHDRRIHRLLPIVSGNQSISLGHETANRM